MGNQTPKDLLQRFYDFRIFDIFSASHGAFYLFLRWNNELQTLAVVFLLNIQKMHDQWFWSACAFGWPGIWTFFLEQSLLFVNGPMEPPPPGSMGMCGRFLRDSPAHWERWSQQRLGDWLLSHGRHLGQRADGLKWSNECPSSVPKSSFWVVFVNFCWILLSHSGSGLISLRAFWSSFFNFFTF